MNLIPYNDISGVDAFAPAYKAPVDDVVYGFGRFLRRNGVACFTRTARGGGGAERVRDDLHKGGDAGQHRIRKP